MPDKPPLSPTLLLRFWLSLSGSCPWLPRWLAARAHREMEAPAERLAERFGEPRLPRPGGRLIWLHAASVGELTSALQLARQMAAQLGLRLLVTTTSATGARLASQSLPAALHQFAPIDTPEAVKGFLDHWRPAAALFVEGDLWPHMMRALSARKIPAALLNARPSKTRQDAPKSYSVLLQPVELVTLQEESLRAEFLSLGMAPHRIHAPGNLKGDIAPPVVDKALSEAWAKAAGSRPVWAAASTHPGEEEIVLDAFQKLTAPTFLLLAPRHPERGDAVAIELTRRAIPFTRQSLGETPGPQTRVHLIDGLGLLGTVYDLAELAVIGGSLLPGPGGHTPYEPAALGCPILVGPHLRNFAATYRDFSTAGAMREVRDASELSRMVARLLDEPKTLRQISARAREVHNRQSGASARSLALLSPLLGVEIPVPVEPVPAPTGSETPGPDLPPGAEGAK